MIFPLLMDHYKVVTTEVFFLLAQDWNFYPSELKDTKKRRLITAVMPRLVCLFVRMSGSDVAAL
jgi:hypothetical protein